MCGESGIKGRYAMHNKREMDVCMYSQEDAGYVKNIY